MITILLGIVSSTVAEIITALNKKLNGTLLQGDAAFLVAFGMAIVGAVVGEIMTPGFTLSSLFNVGTLTSTFSEIFAVSQVYFLLIVQKLDLDVQPTVAPTATATVATPTNASAASAV